MVYERRGYNKYYLILKRNTFARVSMTTDLYILCMCVCVLSSDCNMENKRCECICLWVKGYV